MNKKLEHCASQRGLDLVTFIFVRPDFLSLHSLIEQILNSSPIRELCKNLGLYVQLELPFTKRFQNSALELYQSNHSIFISFTPTTLLTCISMHTVLRFFNFVSLWFQAVSLNRDWLTWLLSSFVSLIASSKHSETCLFSSALDRSSFCRETSISIDLMNFILYRFYTREIWLYCLETESVLYSSP